MATEVNEKSLSHHPSDTLQTVPNRTAKLILMQSLLYSINTFSIFHIANTEFLIKCCFKHY